MPTDQIPSEQHRQSAEDVREKAEDGGGTGDFHSCTGAKQQPGADRTPDRNHGHLSGRKLVAKSFFVQLNGLMPQASAIIGSVM